VEVEGYFMRENATFGRFEVWDPLLSLVKAEVRTFQNTKE
jgi:hypothetical protein